MDHQIILGSIHGLVSVLIGFYAYRYGLRIGRTEILDVEYEYDYTCPERNCSLRIRCNDETTHGVMVSTHILNHSVKR